MNGSDARLDEGFERLGGIYPLQASTFTPMSNEELSDFEDLLGAGLPDDSRRYLSRWGAGGFERMVEFTPVHALPSEISSSGRGFVAYLYGASEARSYSLVRMAETYAGRMPSVLTPIGGDGGGNQILIGVRGAQAGQIFHWNHDAEVVPEDAALEGIEIDWFENVTLIASSFQDLLDRLSIREDL